MSDPKFGSPGISVIMPVHNGARTLDRSLLSVMGQSYPDWELIAVDDGSTDTSYRCLQEWTARDPRIRVFRTAENRGPGASRNLGIHNAKADTVAYLDCDDEYYSDYLENVAKLCDKADVLVFGYDSVQEEDSSSEKVTWLPSDYRGLFFEQNLSTPLGVAHRRDLWSRVGGFNEFLWIQEDWEFWRQLARSGAAFLFVPLTSGLYYIRKGSQSDSPRLTKRQLAAFEANWRAGSSIYADRRQSSRQRGNSKIAFAAYCSYMDLHDVVASSASTVLEILIRNGLSCQAFCISRHANDQPSESVQRLDGLRTPWQSCIYACGPHAARLTYTLRGSVPVTLVGARNPTQGHGTIESQVAELAFYNRFLATYKPDVLLTHSVEPVRDPIVRLARRRDIIVVDLLIHGIYEDPLAFHNVDYCVVDSEEAREYYWERMGLACVSLPLTAAAIVDWRVYTDFFRNLTHQPGPPLIPYRRSTMKGTGL